MATVAIGTVVNVVADATVLVVRCIRRMTTRGAAEYCVVRRVWMAG